MPGAVDAGRREPSRTRAFLHYLAPFGRAVFAGFALIACWKALSAAAPRILPPPERVIPLFAALLPRTLGPHFAASAWRSALAIAVSSLLAFPLGLASGRVRVLDGLLSPIAYVLYPLPKIAFLPLLLLAFGLGDAAKIVLVSLIVFFQVLVGSRDAAKSIDPGYVALARSLGLGKFGRFARVVLPACFPALFSSLRTAAGTAVSALFFAESVSATRGLGFYVMDAWMRVAYAEMAAGILALGFLGLSYFIVIDIAERIACPWKRA